MIFFSTLAPSAKERTGVWEVKPMLSTRMRRAADLLTRSNDPIRLISAECGYDDALAFSKVFKSRFGQNPSDYRLIHNKNYSEE